MSTPEQGAPLGIVGSTRALRQQLALGDPSVDADEERRLGGPRAGRCGLGRPVGVDVVRVDLVDGGLPFPELETTGPGASRIALVEAGDEDEHLEPTPTSGEVVHLGGDTVRMQQQGRLHLERRLDDGQEEQRG